MQKNSFLFSSLFLIAVSFSSPSFSNDVSNALVDGLFKGLGQILSKNKTQDGASPGTEGSASGSGGTEGRDQNKRWSGKKLSDTDLIGFFDKYPNNGNSMITDWPRIAMTIDDVSYGLANGLPGYQSRSSDDNRSCIKYSLVVWMNAKKSKKYDELVACNEDAPSGTNHMLSTYKFRYYRDNNNTRYNRTTGPNPPSTPYPDKANDALAAQFIDQGVCAASKFNFSTVCGSLILSHIFDQLAYNGRVDGDDMRLWIVSVNWKKA
jgi:hypothetical protein